MRNKGGCVKMKLKLPYNYSYDEELMAYLEENSNIIDSVYFSFSKGSRPIKNVNESRYYHLKRLEKIKYKLGCKLNFVMNSVIQIDFTEFEQAILESGIVDIVTLARDDIYKKIRDYNEGEGIKIAYEASRFYNYIEDNKGDLLRNADILTYGFEHELSTPKSEKQLRCFIANERCYEHCDFKIKHNTNVILRNLGKTTEKFSCPYKEKREIYSVEKVSRICNQYNIDLLKICDRTMTDEQLIDVYKTYFPIII